MLSQIYCYRWDVRNTAVNEGVGYGLPLRLDTSPDANYKWTFYIPQKELDFNDKIRN